MTDDKTLSFEQEREEKQEGMEKEEEKDAEEEIELKVKEPPLVEFLKGVDYEDTESSSGIRLNQMLRKYTLRKTRLEERDKEVSAIAPSDTWYRIKKRCLFTDLMTNLYCFNLVESYIQQKAGYIC